MTIEASREAMLAAPAGERPAVLEFFAGIGLSRMGLEAAGFRVSWANDFELDKASMYAAQFGLANADHAFTVGDIGKVEASALPRGAALAWASSPCTDLSLAGGRAGLSGAKSGTFWHFIRLLQDLGEERPEVVVLENVIGLATSNGGGDLVRAISAFNELGYSVDVLTLDARRFVPQSRPRLFLVGAQNAPVDTAADDSQLRPDWLRWVHDSPDLRTHRAPLPPPPALLVDGLDGMVEEMDPDDARWWGQARVTTFEMSLSPKQWSRVDALRHAPGTTHRTAYRRTRGGIPVWEVRPDGVAGCLRTARGGSSKQAVVQMGGGDLRARWMTPVEYARLMGAGDYDLSTVRTNQALFGFGDAVAVPVVAWLAEHYLMPLVRGEMVTTCPGHATGCAPDDTLAAAIAAEARQHDGGRGGCHCPLCTLARAHGIATRGDVARG